MKWYKRDPDAALAGMIGLTLDERGAYNGVIDFYYARDGHVPDDDFLLARVLGCNPRTWRKIKIALFSLRKLTVSEAGELIPNRGEKTLIEARTFSELQSNRRRKNVESAKKPKENNISAQPITTTSTTRVDDDGEHAREAIEKIVTTVPISPVGVRASGVAEVGVRASSASLEAMQLTERIAVIAGIGRPEAWPPSWCGAPLRVQMMLAQGWRADVMLAEAKATMSRKRDGPPSNITYFERAFARAHARQAAPLPIVKPIDGEIINEQFANGSHGGSGFGYSAAGAYFRRRANGSL